MAPNRPTAAASSGAPKRILMTLRLLIRHGLWGSVVGFRRPGLRAGAPSGGPTPPAPGAPARRKSGRVGSPRRCASPDASSFTDLGYRLPPRALNTAGTDYGPYPAFAPSGHNGVAGAEGR